LARWKPSKIFAIHLFSDDTDGRLPNCVGGRKGLLEGGVGKRET
jgi:hypothetical protein